MLRRWDSGQAIIEKLEEYSNKVRYAIVLATPDDEGKFYKEKSTF